MNLLRILLLSFALLPTAWAADVVVLHSTGSRGRIYHQIEIRVEDNGKMTLKTQDMHSEWDTREEKLDAAGMAALEKSLSALDWPRLSEDKADGRDGTSVVLDYRGKKAELWTPGYDSEKRGLVEVQKFIESLYQLAGLTKDGMPLKMPR